MVDNRSFYDSLVMSEMGFEDRNFWFGYSRQKFLHNVDTFYYSVKLQEDFTANSSDPSVLQFRKKFAQLRDRMGYNDCIPFYVEPIGENLNFMHFSYGKYYNVCLEYPGYFDIFIASKVPPAAGSDISVTCEVIVQLRSYLLWLYGAIGAYEFSFRYVQGILDQFGFTIAFVQENRVDYCYHSNYLESPDKFFSMDNFFKMKVSQYKKVNIIASNVGSDGYEVDYLSLGRRGGKCFVRIYLKSKEVVEEGYKAFFFRIWFFHGLISRYDLYCYELAYERRNWNYMSIARLRFYLEYGSDDFYKRECQRYITMYDASNVVTDQMIAFASKLTPKVHLVINVEYQTMRKGSKSYCLLPVRDNSSRGVHKRIYDYFDNRQLIVQYLTHDILRLVNPSSDTNKSRRDYCGFWKALRATRLVDVRPLPDELELIRKYNRKLNKDVMKRTLMNKCVVYGIYLKGKNDDSAMKDAFDALLRMNDNDVMEAQRYKERASRRFNDDDLSGMIEGPAPHDFVLLDRRSGVVYDDDTIVPFNY